MDSTRFLDTYAPLFDGTEVPRFMLEAAVGEVFNLPEFPNAKAAREAANGEKEGSLAHLLAMKAWFQLCDTFEEAEEAFRTGDVVNEFTVPKVVEFCTRPQLEGLIEFAINELNELRDPWPLSVFCQRLEVLALDEIDNKTSPLGLQEMLRRFHLHGRSREMGLLKLIDLCTTPEQLVLEFSKISHLSWLVKQCVAKKAWQLAQK